MVNRSFTIINFVLLAKAIYFVYGKERPSFDSTFPPASSRK